MFRGSWLIILALAGCAGTPAISTPAVSPAGVSAAASPASSSDAPAESATPGPYLDGLLPVELRGTELHTFAVGQDILERLAERLDTAIDRFEVRYASEHGAIFFQTYAVRLPGTDGSAVAEAWADVAYPAEIGDVTVDDMLVAGRSVTVIHSPSAATRLGTFYAYRFGDVLLVVQAMDPDVAAEVLAALP